MKKLTKNLATKVVATLILISYFFQSQASTVRAEFIKKVLYQKHDKYLVLTQDGMKRLIWLSNQKYQVQTTTDMKILTVENAKGTWKQAQESICRGLQHYEKLEYYAGCLSAFGSAACAFTIGPSMGATTVLCEITANYAATKGVEDCISGAMDNLAEVIARDKDRFSYNLGKKIGKEEFIDAIKTTLLFVCKDTKGEGPRIGSSPVQTPPSTRPTPGPIAVAPRNNSDREHGNVADHNQRPGGGEKSGPDKSGKSGPDKSGPEKSATKEHWNVGPMHLF